MKIRIMTVLSFASVWFSLGSLVEHDAEGRFFFSPIFVGPSGGPAIVPPDILLQFKPNVARDDVERLLRAGGVRSGTREPFTRRLENAFKVRTNERSGIDVLAISNRLSEMTEVVFAEPNMIISGRSAGNVDEEIVPTDPGFEDRGQPDCPSWIRPLSRARHLPHRWSPA